MELKFRDLRADEIDCRVAMVKEKGISLLLYKDARCDMIILDETVGPMNWQRSHARDNANCIVSIRDSDTGEWVSKEDTGTESNTEAEKGLASDSFKRACFNWGIGRELYTAPFIWISSDKGSKTDRYSVADIVIENKKITALSIKNESSGNVVYTYGTGKAKAAAKPKTTKAAPAPANPAPATPAQSAPVAVAEQEGVIPGLRCKRCSGEIKGIKLKNGGTMTAEQVKAYGQNKFPDWDALCAKCQSDLFNANKEA